MATDPGAGPAAGRVPSCRLAPLRGRGDLDALRRRGRRARAGHLGVTYLPPSGPPAVGRATGDPVPGTARTAFAVDRRAGTAVVRNRIRRRLRAGLRELAGTGVLRPGAYLVRARGEAATQAWPQLLADLDTAVRRATVPEAHPPS